jgi:hypothetical protein
LAGALASPAAQSYVSRAPAESFGLNAQGIGLSPTPRDDPAALKLHTDSIAGLGIRLVRVNLDWREAEPIGPIAGIHSYRWGGSDTLVAQAARSGLRVYPDLAGSPTWATSVTRIASCTASLAHPAPTDVASFAAYAGAVAQRYGPGGTFWAQNGGLPYRPVLQIELWNEPNWTFWCPAPEPETYADMLTRSADAIHAAAPATEAILGGLVVIRPSAAPTYAMATDQFLQRVFAARPQLVQKLGAVGIHPYDADPEDVLGKIAWARKSLDAAGGSALPLDVNEIGWPTQGDSTAIDEQSRAAFAGELAHQLWRTDCGIERMFLHTWRTAELVPIDREDWFGVADPDTAAPYPTARSYAAELGLATGAGPTAAPRSLVRACGGPAPDRDGDGFADHVDDYPLDPAAHTGGSETAPDSVAGEVRTRPPRVPDTFFGLDGGTTWSGDDAVRKDRMDAIAVQGFGSYRIAVSWQSVQPTATTAASMFDWAAVDSQVRHAAGRGLQPRLYVVSKPSWAGTQISQVAGVYAEFTRALVARYGPGGAFWTENPGLPYLPARDWEVWSGAQQSSAWWDGSASPAEYAQAYSATRAAITEVDPNGRALVSVFRDLGGYTAGNWIRQLGVPVDGAVVDARFVTGSLIEAMLADVRTALGGGSKPLAPIVGLNTQGPGAVSESQRTQAYDTIGRRLALSNCGIDTAIFYAWTTPEQDASSAFDWLGLAPVGAPDSPYPSALALGSLAAAFGGWSAAPAPTDPALICGTAAPDRDGDGTPDASDEYPVDPSRQSGPQPPPVITVAPPVRTASRHAAFAYIRPEPHTSAFHCRIDGGQWRDCSAGTQSYDGLADGTHTFSVRALDRYSLAAGPVDYTWKVNPPSLVAPQITAGPDSVAFGTPVEFSFSGDAGARFGCQIDGGGVADCSSPAHYEGLARGTHTFAVRQAIGDERSPFASRQFTVAEPQQDPPPPEPPPSDPPSEPPAQADTTPPSVSIDRVKRARKRARLYFSANEPASFECRLDRQSPAPCSSPQSYRKLKRGRHTVEVTATDPSGNSASATATFKVKKRRR